MQSELEEITEFTEKIHLLILEFIDEADEFYAQVGRTDVTKTILKDILNTLEGENQEPIEETWFGKNFNRLN